MRPLLTGLTLLLGLTGCDDTTNPDPGDREGGRFEPADGRASDGGAGEGGAGEGGADEGNASTDLAFLGDGPSPDPDAAPPDAAREGPLTLLVDPAAITLVEGRSRSLTLTVEGALAAPLTVELSAGALIVDPAELIFQVDGPRALSVTLSAAWDTDEQNGHEILKARPMPPPTPPPPEERAVGVDVPVTIVDAQVTLGFALDDEQLAFVSSSRDKERRLIVGTTLGDRPGPAAEINLRGKGTLNCPRRSFTVRFAEPVVLADSPPLEQVLLLSMCMDATYLKMHSSMGLLQAEGLFPPWTSYLELRYGGQSRGVYLVVERPRRAIARLHPSNRLLIRRLNDSTEEVKRPSEASFPDDAAREATLAPYRALFQRVRELHGEALLSWLRAHMDYDHYLRWLAVNSLLLNGDYIDELYFFDRPGPQGAADPYLDVMAWDYDDILRGCHNRGPIDEPLMYCAESRLDRPVRDEPEVQAVYVQILRSLIETSLGDAYTSRVRRSAEELQIYFARDGVIEAMTRDDPPPDPLAAAGEMAARVAERRAELMELLP